MWLAPLAILVSIALQGPHHAECSMNKELLDRTMAVIAGDLINVVTESLGGDYVKGGGGQESFDELDSKPHTTSITEEKEHAEQDNTYESQGHNKKSSAEEIEKQELHEKHNDEQKNTESSSDEDKDSNMKEFNSKHQERSKRSSDTSSVDSDSSDSSSNEKQKQKKDVLIGDNQHGFNIIHVNSYAHKKGLKQHSGSDSSSSDSDSSHKNNEKVVVMGTKQAGYNSMKVGKHHSISKRSSESSSYSDSSDDSSSSGNKKHNHYYKSRYNKNFNRLHDIKIRRGSGDSSQEFNKYNKHIRSYSRNSAFSTGTNMLYPNAGYSGHPSIYRYRRDLSDEKVDKEDTSSSSASNEDKKKKHWQNSDEEIVAKHSSNYEESTKDGNEFIVMEINQVKKDNDNNNFEIDETDAIVMVKENKCPNNKCPEIDDKKRPQQKPGVMKRFFQKIKNMLNGSSENSKSSHSSSSEESHKHKKSNEK